MYSEESRKKTKIEKSKLLILITPDKTLTQVLKHSLIQPSCYTTDKELNKL